MDGIDPDTLLEWLQTGFGDERDLQMMALEQLCMLLLMSDNIDRCFESCPPRTFLPALCKIFIDESATDNVLEVTARAITYYLDVSNECTRRITQVDGAVKAICSRLAAADLSDRASKDLAEQCVKLLEHVCQRETLAVYDAGGLNAMLTLVTNHTANIHKDTLHSAMSVVTRLCGKMEPTDDALPACTKSLGALLSHDDAKVSECALRCFAALTDRCMRKQVDPVTLATHSDLVTQLLHKLQETSTSTPSTNFTSIVLSLISNLCRGSPVITEQVLNSTHLVAGLSSVLSLKDERCVCDGLRLADLILLLLCEGRSALPATAVVAQDSAAASMGSGGSGASTAEKTHRHLIDVIRQKDTGGLIEAVESGMVDVNYTDDVGQTLLNWASAFGSIEMVVFLCDKGADVNKGHKSSSLHYAASFGRPDVTKLLLQRGANPDLRDEDGKTALDKARERTEEDYVAVSTILETPSLYTTTTTQQTAAQKKEEGSRRKVSTTHALNKKRALLLLRSLIPLFCEIYQKAQSAASKRSSLTLLRKAVQHFTKIEEDEKEEEDEEKEEEMPTHSDRRLAETILEVIVGVLDLADDFEAQEQALMVVDALLNKDSVRWVDELIRLGVFEKVESMATELENALPPSATAPPPPPPTSSLSTNDERGSERSLSTTPSLALSDTTEGSTIPEEREREKERASMLKISTGVDESADTPPPTLETGSIEGSSREEVTELQPGLAYRWREWRIVKSDDSLFVWADPLALEFLTSTTDTAQPCLRFLSDGTLKAFQATGRAEECSQADKTQFIERFRKALASVPGGIKTARFVCMVPGTKNKCLAPNWEISATRPVELIFKNTTHAGVAVKLNDEMAGIVFEYKDNGKSSVSADSLLDPEFHTGWTTFSTCARSSRLRSSMQARRVQDLALSIWRRHLKEARAKPREALVQLQAASAIIQEAVKTASKDASTTRSQPRIERVQELVSALECVRQAGLDDRLLSTYEIASSGLVPSLTALLRLTASHPEAYPAVIFKETFRNSEALAALAIRMVRVLEATEKFPLYLYDAPGGSGFGLQLLSRRIRMRLALGVEKEGQEEKENNNTLLDRTGRVLKSEPLTTVSQLKNFLLKMVAKQWFDRDRASFSFVKKAKGAANTSTPITFTYTSDFDDQGIVYWIGTNGRETSEWSNPAGVGVIHVVSSDHPRQPFGRPEDILSRDTNALNCHTSDDKNAHFTIDLGVIVRPTHYTIRHARGYGKSALRSWMLQGSMDNTVWESVSCHKNDTSLGNEPGSIATWPIEGGEQKGPYRYFRIAQNGENSSGSTHYLSVSGFEIYGLVVDAIDTELRPVEESEKGKKMKTPTTSRIPTLPTAPKGKRGKQAQAASSSRTAQGGSALSEAEYVESLPSKRDNNRLAVMTMEDCLMVARANQPTPSSSKHALQSRVRMASRRLRQLADIVGSKVQRGPNWRWGEQDGGKEGIVVSPPEAGWLDVEWENGNTNSYRFGADGKYDVIRVDGNDRKKGSSETRAVDSALSGLVGSSGFSLGGLSSTLGLRPKRGSAAAAVNLGPSSASPSSSKFRLVHTMDASVAISRPSDAASSSSSSAIVTPATTIGKKSMSTTNLVEDRVPVVSVSATGQAASAESLQHQTPSLENLLANYGRSHRQMETLFDEAGEASVEGMESTEEAEGSSIGGDRTIEGSSRLGSWQGEDEEDEDVDVEEAKEAGGESDTGDSSKNLSVSAPNLAEGNRRPSESVVEDEDEAEEDEEGENDRDDKSVTDAYTALLHTLHAGSSQDRGFLDRIRDVMGYEFAMDALLAADPPAGTPSSSHSPKSTTGVSPSATPTSSTGAVASTSSSAASGGKKAAAAIKTKVTSYADVLKNMMQQMMEPSGALGLLDGEEIDDEEMYEDVDANEDDLEEELAASSFPMESIAHLLGRDKGDLRSNFRQLTQLMLGHRGGDRVNMGRDPGAGNRNVSAYALRQWDEEFVLKCTFNALIPAFDPRPGRTNVKQTIDVELPAAVNEILSQRRTPPQGTPTDTTLRLFLTGPNLPGVDNVTVEMDTDDTSVFRFVQKIANHVSWSQADRCRRLWEPTYTLTYEDGGQPSKVTVSQLPVTEVIPNGVAQVLTVLSLLARVGGQLPDCDLSPSLFVSEKITHKLRQELSDPLVVAADALPEWCERLVFEHPCLFTVETKQTYLQATAFGVTRSLVWLQGRRDAALERSRGGNTASSSAAAAALSSARRDDQYEYRLGRIKHERVKINRSEEHLLEQAVRLLRFHAERKSVLEIEYLGEEGTGLGPTLEFYALVAAEFQRKALAMWMCDDLDETQLKMEEGELDLGEGKKPPGFYVRRASGLFPAPLPPDSDDAKRASELYKVLGVFLAKVLQDGRLVDLPLARSFLKLIAHPSVSHTRHPQLDGVLSLDDLEEVHPVKGRFLKELSALVARKRGIEADGTLDREAKRRRLEGLSLCINGTRCSIEALGLNFTVNPPSTVFSYDEMELVEGGSDIDVTIDNVDVYVDKCTDYYLNSGIRQQVTAFRSGFDRVFPLSALRGFSSDEVQRLISGEQCPEWTREDIITQTEPKLGYTRESPVFLRFVDVLVDMNASERKRFLQFATGCSNLPPGGLANLHPRLTIVRKVESGDGSYPSVNTCVHYLKLPEYSSKEILRERLLTACNEKGFHLN